MREVSKTIAVLQGQTFVSNLINSAIARQDAKIIFRTLHSVTAPSMKANCPNCKQSCVNKVSGSGD